ncbi:DUF5105 domain-containing protein [Bacillus cereus group sp. BfR-BA-01380]|uniref:DUF5105 domain-containing protein n=1 Tax=Bacillus cereus group sp. BfR-BA-01380 TaxID=2920324 RepID=UPI001F5986A9|nr:DUF5105 domain-containing protein [Bacillus cereus group sp. BfR-BA-01380]
MHFKKLVSASLLAALTIGGLSACNSSEGSAEVKQGSVSKDKNVKKSKKSKSYELTIEGAEYALPNIDKKTINGQVLKVNISVKNLGKKSLRVSNDDFSVYVKDEKMKSYSKYVEGEYLFNIEDIEPNKKVSGVIYFDVKEASSYELVYKKRPDIEDENEKEEKTTFTIDSKGFADKRKELNRPAEALTAYLNAGFYDKDLDKMTELTGEDGKKFNEMLEKSVTSSGASVGLSSITEESMNNYFKNFKTALQKNVKFETNVVSVDKDGKTAEVEIKSKPLVFSSIRTKVQDKQTSIRSENPSMTYQELAKKSFDYMSSLLPEAEVSSTEESAKIEMHSNGDNKWHIDEDGIKDLARVFYKS